MTDIDLDALEATARAATPGPWGRATSATRDWALVLSASGTAVEYRVSQSVDDDDAEHIAAFDPPTVLALIARLREAEAVIEEATAAIGKVNEWDGHGRADQLDNTRAILSRHKTTKTEGNER